MHRAILRPVDSQKNEEKKQGGYKKWLVFFPLLLLLISPPLTVQTPRSQQISGETQPDRAGSQGAMQEKPLANVGKRVHSAVQQLQQTHASSEEDTIKAFSVFPTLEPGASTVTHPPTSTPTPVPMHTEMISTHTPLPLAIASPPSSPTSTPEHIPATPTTPVRRDGSMQVVPATPTILVTSGTSTTSAISATREQTITTSPLPTFAPTYPTPTPQQLPDVGFVPDPPLLIPTTIQPALPPTFSGTNPAQRTFPMPASGEIPYIPILMYHYVRDVDKSVDPVGYRLSVSPEQFAGHLAWLAREGYTPMRMDEVAACLKGIGGCPERPVALTFDDGYDDAYTEAFPLLRRHGFVATFYIVSSFVGHEGYMRWDELQILQNAGMEIGSHSVTHPDLTTLAQNQVSYQVTQSAEEIKTHLQIPVESFCYPIGKNNTSIQSIVKEAGYSNATTTMQSWYQRNLYALPRLRISGELSQAGFEGLVRSYTSE
jgi:peptidoglycan/xylan/chitin deacetylase (PgdA/CDA1 family)